MNLEDLYRLLRSGHIQTQGIVDTLGEPLTVLDRTMSIITANPAFYKTFGTERESTIGQSLFDLGNGQWDIPELRRLLGEVVPKAAAIIGYQVDHNFPDIGQRTMLVSARQLSHPDSNSSQMLVVFEDVTERQNADAAKDILVAETRHRMGNLMAMLRSIAHQTEAKGRTGEEYRDSFMGRFEAVLSAQEFISMSDGETELGVLVRQSLKMVRSEQIVIEPAPAVGLTQYQVQPVSMILHELATNAVKYGALSSNAGVVHIGWNTEVEDGKSHAVLDWREEGGPPVVSPNRQGFGTKLIGFSSKADGGEAVFDYDPAGLRVKLSFPIGK